MDDVKLALLGDREAQEAITARGELLTPEQMEALERMEDSHDE